MRNIITIAKRELLSFFVSPVAYFVIAGFTLLAGYFFFAGLEVFNLVVERYASSPYRNTMDAPNLNQWLVEGLYKTMIVIFVFCIPLLTMRLIAEERKNGTFELLITSPISVWDIVLGKFIAVGTVITAMVLGVFVFPLILCFYGNPEIAPLFTGALGLLLCGLAFAAIGMAVSSFTENQVVAGVVSMVTLLLLYVINSSAESIGGTGGAILNYLSPVFQVEDLVQGVLSLKSGVYFITLIALGLFISERVLEAYRWR
jgi:ABC-2 type transport system permease protein